MSHTPAVVNLDEPSRCAILLSVRVFLQWKLLLNCKHIKSSGALFNSKAVMVNT